MAGQKHNSPKPWPILMVVWGGVFMSTMDSSMINVALPVIMESFHSSMALTEWVVLAYLLTITTLLPVWGNISDRGPRSRLYSRGMLVFALGSLLCSISGNIYSLVGSRLIQGLGASMIMAVGPALIKSVFPSDQLGRGMGMVGVATSLGLMSGPFISGQLLRWVHWRAIFWVTVPLSLLFFLLGLKPLSVLRRARRDSAAREPASHPPFDRGGAVLWAIAILISMLVATHAASFCGLDSFAAAFPLGGVVLIILAWSLLLLHQRQCPAPLLPLTLLKQRFFFMAILSAMLSFTVLFSVLILIPFYLDNVLQLAPDKIGLVMMAIPLSVFCVSPLAGHFHDRIGAAVVATTGLTCCLVSLLLLTGLTAESTPFAVAARLALLGFGQAMFLAPNSAAALNAVPDKKAGITAGMLATARNLGMMLGTAFTGIVFTCYFSHLTGGMDMKDFIPAVTPEFMHAMTRTLQGASVLALGGVLASWSRGKREKT